MESPFFYTDYFIRDKIPYYHYQREMKLRKENQKMSKKKIFIPALLAGGAAVAAYMFAKSNELTEETAEEKTQEEPKEMGPVQFYHDMTASVGLVKLVPSMPADILDYVAGRCDAGGDLRTGAADSDLRFHRRSDSHHQREAPSAGSLRLHPEPEAGQPGADPLLLWRRLYQ